MKTTTPMIISVAAATRLFIKIATIFMEPFQKCKLMETVTEIIEGRLDINQAVFSGEEGEEIRSYLAKAIIRSTKARAIAARRRKSAENVTVSEIPTTVEPATTIQTTTESFEKIEIPDEETRTETNTESEQAVIKPKRKRRKRRRRH